MRDKSKQLLVINTGKKKSEQTGMPSQSGTTHIIGGGGLSVNMSDYLLKSIWDKVFEIRTDSQGTEYIFGKLPMVTQYGITMYSGDGVDIPSLASGLPFDGRTIWYNPDTQQIEVIGGTGGGSGEGVSNFWDLSGIPSWITNSKPKYTYSEIERTPDLSMYAQVDTLKAYVTLAGAQTLTGEKNFTGGLKVNGSPIIYDSANKYWKLQGNLVLTGGITMYADDGTLNLPSIYDGLPIDGTTIYWDTDASGNRVLKAVGGGGTAESVAWSNITGKPSWIGSSKPVYSYSEIQGTPDLSVYALKTQIPSLSGYATESWVTKQNYATKATTLSGYGITDAYTKTNVDDLLKAYVTLSGEQTISGKKNFTTGGLFVNGSQIKYDATKKYWKLEGDLLVTGGVTMYGNEGTYTPSTIMDALLYDDTTLGINSNGQLYVKGGTSGGGLDITALQNHLTQNSYLNVTSGDNRYLKLSGGTLTLPNHVGLVIKRTNVNSPVIAFYNNDELEHNYIGFEGNRPIIMNKSGVTSTIWHSGNFTPSNYLPLSGGTITSASPVSVILNANNDGQTALFLQSKGTNKTYVGWDINRGTCLYDFSSDSHFGILNGIPRFNSNTIWHSGNDGSGSGLDADLLDGVQSSGYGKYVDDLTINLNDARDGLRGGKLYNATNAYDSTDAAYRGFLEYGSSGYRAQFNSSSSNNLYYRWCEANTWKPWRKVAFEDSNVASAAKLQTARTIWGQSFDGTGNVDGKILLTSWDNDGIGLRFYNNTKGAAYISMYAADGNAYLFGQNGSRFLINHNVYGDIFNILGGNVGIGTTNPAQKLHIVGRAKIESSDRYALEVSSTSSTGSHVLSFNGTGGNESAQIGFGANGVYAFNYAAYRNNSNNITAFGIDLNGIFYLGYSGNPNATNSRLTVDGSGNLLAKGGITMYSQKSLKNIQDERGLSLAEMSIIKPTRYTWKDGRDNRLHFGGIADDIQQVLPEVVYKTSDGILTMDYGNAAFAVASSLIKPVVDHEKRIAMLEEENKHLRKEVERLKSA